MLAKARGTTIRGVVEELAALMLTQHERMQREAHDRDYIRERFGHEFADEELEEGDRFWRELRERGGPGTR